MIDAITKEQLEEIEEEYSYGSRETAYALLKEYTGIEARPYTAYMFFDEADNYVGDSENDDFEELLRKAYIKVIDKGGD